MIEEIEGPTPEPTRRGHVAVMSAVVASISIALLAFLIAVPASRISSSPELALATASPSVVPAMSVLFARGLDVPATLSGTWGWCAIGRRLVPPYHISIDAANGRAMAIGPDPRTGLSVPMALVRNTADGWLTVTCITPGNAMPLDAIAR